MVTAVTSCLAVCITTSGGTTSPACRDHGRSGCPTVSSCPFFYHDGTERPVQRPVDADEQGEYYSGKKKCHTIKNMLLTDEACYIRFMSETYAGKWHEKSIVDAAHYRLPAGSVLYQDMGFQGFAVVDVTIQQPTKKPRGGELTAEQKANNRQIASTKMRIEHTI